MEEYRRAEDKALEQIAKLYGLQPPMPTEIKVADKRLMVTEALVLMNERGKNSDYWSELAQPYGMETIKLIEEEARNNDMRNVELRFLRKWNELFHSHKVA